MKFSRVHLGEWLTGLFGLVLLAGLILPWSGDQSALASPGLLDVILLLIAIPAILLPLVVARSRYTNVPVVFETLLWTVSLLFAIVMIVKSLFPPAAGFDSGFWLALAGTLGLSFSVWRSVARER